MQIDFAIEKNFDATGRWASFFAGSTRGGACIWIEKVPARAGTPLFKPEFENEDGEYVVWWYRLKIIITPPGLKAPKQGDYAPE